MKAKIDRHMEYLKHLVESINAINEWREEAIKHAITPMQRAAVDREAFVRRDRIERASRP